MPKIIVIDLSEPYGKLQVFETSSKGTRISGKGYKASTGEDAGKTNAKRQPKHRKGYKERIKEGKCKQDGKKGQEKGKASTVAKQCMRKEACSSKL